MMQRSPFYLLFRGIRLVCDRLVCGFTVASAFLNKLISWTQVDAIRPDSNLIGPHPLKASECEALAKHSEPERLIG